jgi:hypothetical protein
MRVSQWWLGGDFTDWTGAGLPNALALLQLCSELFIVSGLSCNLLKD